jgi:hypothetical protein
VRVEVEQTLGQRFGTAVPLRLVVDTEAAPVATSAPVPAPASSAGGGAAPAELTDDDSALLDPVVLAAETEPAGAALSPEQRLKQVFPGAQEL